MDVVSNNIANIQTTGFRRDDLTFQERLTEAVEDYLDTDYYNEAVDRYGGAPHMGPIYTDHRPGSLERTGGKLEFAVVDRNPSRRSFFRLQEVGSGRMAVTRAGNFVVDSVGRLVTPDGRYTVTTKAGEPIEIEAGSSADILVKETGDIFVNGTLVNQLGVVSFEDPRILRKNGDTTFEVSEGVEPLDEVFDGQVLQGHLEASNADPLGDMVEMIRAMRILESNLTRLKAQDATLERAINDLARLPG
jgi:flagellar basal-body rod protein FlgG